MDTKALIEIIDHLKKRPGMYIPLSIKDITYTVYCTYLDGICAGFRWSLGINIDRDIALWLFDSSQVAWHARLRYNNKDKSEEELISLLLDTFKNYFIENPNWNIAKPSSPA